MRKLFFYLKKISKLKFQFKLPKKNRVVLYDEEGDHIMSLFLNKKDYHSIDTRLEKINISVLIISLFKNFFRNIKLNYILDYISWVNPELVICTVDNDVRFYNLKNKFNKAKFISIQLSARDEDFYNILKKYHKKNNFHLSVDDFFVISQNEKQRLSQYIKSNFHIIGTLKNNLYSQVKKFKPNETFKKIVFITPKFPTDENILKKEKLIFEELYKICSEKKWALSLCTKNSSKSIYSNEKNYRKNLVAGDWTFLINDNQKASYKAINENDIIVYTDSTLGLEALIKKKRCIALPPFNFPFPKFNIKYNNEGPFWSCDISEKNIRRLLEKVQKYNEKEWSEIVDQYIGKIFSYDPQNKTYLAFLDKFGLETKFN